MSDSLTSPLVPLAAQTQKPIRVRICDKQHPHYGETGVMTGKIITMKFGTREQMAEITLENCRHGVDRCFVKKGQVEGIR